MVRGNISAGLWSERSQPTQSSPVLLHVPINVAVDRTRMCLLVCPMVGVVKTRCGCGPSWVQGGSGVVETVSTLCPGCPGTRDYPASVLSLWSAGITSGYYHTWLWIPSLIRPSHLWKWSISQVVRLGKRLIAEQTEINYSRILSMQNVPSPCPLIKCHLLGYLWSIRHMATVWNSYSTHCP